MALIKCPECGKDFSDSANACPNCGYRLDPKTRQISIITRNWDAYNTNFVCASSNQQAKYYIDTLANDLYLHSPQNQVEYAIISNAVSACMESLSRSYYDTPEKLQYVLSYIDTKLNETLNSLPRCLTCGSYEVKRISELSKGIGFSLWGMASSKVGKSYQCSTCGYTW